MGTKAKKRKVKTLRLGTWYPGAKWVRLSTLGDDGMRALTKTEQYMKYHAIEYEKAKTFDGSREFHRKCLQAAAKKGRALRGREEMKLRRRTRFFTWLNDRFVKYK